MVRSLWLATALALYCAGGALSLLAWALWGAGTQSVWIAAAAVLWLGCSLLAGWFWHTAPCGTLVWTGTDWTLESPQGSPLCAPSARLQVHLDLQRCLWLRLPPIPSPSSPARWLWLEQRSQPLLWDDLRRAVYSPVRAGDPSTGTHAGPNASNIAPHRDPQA